MPHRFSPFDAERSEAIARFLIQHRNLDDIELLEAVDRAFRQASLHDSHSGFLLALALTQDCAGAA